MASRTGTRTSDLSVLTKSSSFTAYPLHLLDKNGGGGGGGSGGDVKVYSYNELFARVTCTHLSLCTNE